MKRRIFLEVIAAGIGFLLLWSQPADAGGTNCVGDCNADREVTIDELITMVNVALGEATVAACLAGDGNADEEITIDEIIGAVGNALDGCPPTTGCTQVNVEVTLGFDPSVVPSVAGVTLNLDYPMAAVSIPGSLDDGSVVERVTDISDAFGFFDVQDLDTNSDAADDRLRASYVTTSAISPGPLLNVLFDCNAGAGAPTAMDFACSVPDASDGGGFRVDGVTCAISVTEP